MRYSVLLVVVAALLVSCNKEKPLSDPSPTVYKNNSVELLLHTRTLPDGRVVMHLQKHIYINHEKKVDSIISIDTLPNLGKETFPVYDEDDDGNQINHTEVESAQYDILFKVDSLK